MKELLECLSVKWTRMSGARAAEIDAVEGVLGVRLPHDYRELMEWSNGGEGWIGATYVSLWQVSELPKLNADYEITACLPEIIGIGSDGGGECFGLRYGRGSDRPALVQVPFGDLDRASVTVLGDSLREGLQGMLRL